MSSLSCLPLLTLNKDMPGAEDSTTSEQDMQSLRRVFDACDENGDGFLTLEELCAWMKKLDLHLTREALAGLVKASDVNLDGRLDFGEFIALATTLDGGNSRRTSSSSSCSSTSPENADTDVVDPAVAELREAFTVFDKDGNGLISASELKSTLSQLGLLSASTHLSRIHSMIRKVDMDGDGEVSFSEFQVMMMMRR